MAKKLYTTPSVEIELLQADVLMFSSFDNLGEDKDDWGIPQ